MLAVCEGVFRVVNLRRWQEEVLYFWRLDEAANVEVGRFEGPSPGLGAAVGAAVGAGVGAGVAPGPSPGQQRPAGSVEREGSVSGGKVNSVIEGEGRVRSEFGGDGGMGSPLAGKGGRARSVKSLG